MKVTKQRRKQLIDEIMKVTKKSRKQVIELGVNEKDLKDFSKQNKFTASEWVRLNKAGFHGTDFWYLPDQEKYTVDECVRMKKEGDIQGIEIDHLAKPHNKFSVDEIIQLVKGGFGGFYTSILPRLSEKYSVEECLFSIKYALKKLVLNPTTSGM